MKYVISSFLFHLFMIFLFSVIYYFIEASNFKFDDTLNRSPEYIDYLSLSTTLQSGVGLSDLAPATQLSSLLIVLQQLILIGTNVLIVYVIFKKR